MSTEGAVQALSTGIVHRTPVTLDQLSLWDCPFLFPQRAYGGQGMWLPVCHLCRLLWHRNRGLTPFLLRLSLQQIGPEQLQRLIAEAVQSSLSDRLPVASTVPSMVACPSVAPDSDGQDEDCLSLMAPDSLLTSHYDNRSLIEGVDSAESELSEDEGLPPD